MHDVIGVIDPRFDEVKEAFVNNFVVHDEIGASLCLAIDGQIVIDIAAGHLDPVSRRSWTPDTLVNSFSVGKGVLAIVLADLVAHGAVEFDQPVISIWPELLAAQSTGLTVRDVAGHRAGLPAISVLLDNGAIYQWSTMREALEQQEPWWTPGTTHGYHVNTFGFLLGEILTRVAQCAPSRLLDSFRPVLKNDLYFGVPSTELHRVADLQWNPPQTSTTLQQLDSLDDETRLKVLTYSNPPNFSGVTAVNTSQWRQTIHPSTNLHATARGVAQMFDRLRAEAGRIPPSVVEEASRTVSRGRDVILDSETHFGSGFQLPTVKRSFGPHPDALGHYGAGGAVGFYDPTARLSFGYVMNKMGQGWQNERNQALISSVYACL